MAFRGQGARIWRIIYVVLKGFLRGEWDLLAAFDGYLIKQEIRSWFESNTRFPSTTPAAHINSSAGLLTLSHFPIQFYRVQ